MDRFHSCKSGCVQAFRRVHYVWTTEIKAGLRLTDSALTWVNTILIQLSCSKVQGEWLMIIFYLQYSWHTHSCASLQKCSHPGFSCQYHCMRYWIFLHTYIHPVIFPAASSQGHDQGLGKDWRFWALHTADFASFTRPLWGWVWQSGASF